DLFAELGAGEVAVVHHLVLGQAQVLGDARVTQVLERVAAGAVVHVQLGATLQRALVTQVDTGMLQAAFGRGERTGRHQQAGGEGGEPDEHARTRGGGLGAGKVQLSHASSPVPAPAWSCRSWSTAAS